LLVIECISGPDLVMSGLSSNGAEFVNGGDSTFEHITLLPFGEVVGGRNEIIVPSYLVLPVKNVCVCCVLKGTDVVPYTTLSMMIHDWIRMK
jgi:hypothetical protein